MERPEQRKEDRPADSRTTKQQRREELCLFFAPLHFFESVGSLTLLDTTQ
jgi:hypothetical protein